MVDDTIRAGETTLPQQPSAAAASPVEPTDLFEQTAENYELAEELARGGMGVVRLAHDRRLGRTVAVKEIIVDDDALARRFEREARITAALQHPSIVGLLEAGRLPSGRPFYAMPLVRGRSLDVVMAEKTTLDERLALVPNVLAVADALAYAHEERVIHRDLKPRNVLVGRFGETIVIDWGLAKRLDSTDSEPPQPGGRPVKELETEAGSVMGTLVYMPPEQAKGDRVDERCDVYAIGAILMHVLSGKPPYEGRTLSEIYDALTAGPPVPIEEREPGTPRELAAIVARAMARDPAARYPTARELAEDLRRFQTGQLVGAHRYSRGELMRRWLRRHRAAAIAATVIAVVGAVAVQRVVAAKHVADAERNAARESRADAERLLDFMVSNLRGRLRSVGRLDLLEDVTREALAYYDRQRAGSTAERGQRARALLELSNLVADQGHLADALVHDRTALEIAHELRASEPRDRAWRGLEADARQAIASHLARQGDFTSAERELVAATALYDELIASDHSDAEALGAASTHESLADLYHERKDGDRALGELDRVLRIATPSAIHGEKWHLLVTAAHMTKAHVLTDRGDRQGALAESRLALDAATQGSREAGNPPAWQQQLAAAHLAVGLAYLEVGNLPTALDESRAGASGFDALVATDPANLDWLHAAAESKRAVAQVLDALGKDRDAIAESRAALAAIDKVISLAPRDATYRHFAAGIHEQLARSLGKTGDHAGALAEGQIEYGIYHQLFVEQPGEAQWQLQGARAQLLMGLTRAALGDRAAALTDVSGAEASLAQLMARAPDDVDILALRVTALTKLAELQAASSQPRIALDTLNRTTALLEPAIAKTPSSVVLVSDLAEATAQIADVKTTLGDTRGARESYVAALATARRVLALSPDDADMQAFATEIEGLITPR